MVAVEYSADASRQSSVTAQDVSRSRRENLTIEDGRLMTVSVLLKSVFAEDFQFHA